MLADKVHDLLVPFTQQRDAVVNPGEVDALLRPQQHAVLLHHPGHLQDDAVLQDFLGHRLNVAVVEDDLFADFHEGDDVRHAAGNGHLDAPGQADGAPGGQKDAVLRHYTRLAHLA